VEDLWCCYRVLAASFCSWSRRNFAIQQRCHQCFHGDGGVHLSYRYFSITWSLWQHSTKFLNECGWEFCTVCKRDASVALTCIQVSPAAQFSLAIQALISMAAWSIRLASRSPACPSAPDSLPIRSSAHLSSILSFLSPSLLSSFPLCLFSLSWSSSLFFLLFLLLLLFFSSAFSPLSSVVHWLNLADKFLENMSVSLTK
jgi:hypothetical protein